VLQVGGILTSAYLIAVVAHALSPASAVSKPRGSAIPQYQQAAALALVLCSLLLGLVPWQVWLPLPATVSAPDPFGLEALWSMFWPILIGGFLAIALGRWRNRRPSRVALWLEHADAGLREWPAAGISLVAVAVLLIGVLLFGR
jgi:hypothetical protein